MLETKEMLKLLSGKGMWHTNSLDGKVDTLFMSDGPHGLRAQSETTKKNNKSCEATCFPTASALAASWDRELVARVASAIADEARAEGVSILLGPGVNIKRSPLCGRNFEYFSEDPFLAGNLAMHYINAVQAKGVGTSMKHFAGNSQERNRMRQNSQIDERTLNEIYLRAFEIAVRGAQPATIMASYNRINGYYACMNESLLEDTLRNKWGFEGAVVSDWGACLDLTKCIKAGMDIEMPGNGGEHLQKLAEDLERGVISENEVRRSEDRILNLIEKYGEKHADPMDAEERRELLKKNHEIAVEAAKECAVLLKNDGILPLKRGTELTIVGDLAATPRIQGGGSSHINTESSRTFLEVLEAAGVKYRFEKGYDSGDDKVDARLEEKAVELVRSANGPVLFFGGLTDLAEGEGYDRETLHMPEDQMKLLNKIRKLNKDLIFISFGGSPYDMAPAEFAKAILHMYLCGEGVMEAAESIIFGDTNPSGKLAETFPYSIIDTPAYGNYSTENLDICYNECLYVGYRYYDTLGVDVRYPFGYGLSYTNFEYSDLSVSFEPEHTKKVKVKFNITNTGSVEGKETAQIYVKNSLGRIMRPFRELRGFEKVNIKPGETVTVETELDDHAFSIYDVETGTFIPVNGEYEIQVCSNVRDIELSVPVKLQGADFLDISGVLETPHIASNIEFVKLYGKPMSNFTHTEAGHYDLSNSISQLAKESFRGKLLKGLLKGVARLMFIGKSRKDPEVRMYIETVEDGPIDLIVCQSGGMLKMKWAERIVESANKNSLKKQNK